MIHYHGLPITPEAILGEVMTGAHFFVSFEDARQLSTAAEIGASFAVDNGAFSRWSKGDAVKDWLPFYEWVKSVSKVPSFDFAVIPDVIDGTEEDNDALVDQWPFSTAVGAPVWHLHESLERLSRLARNFERVCLGSSGEFARIGTDEWWSRMEEAMATLCPDGQPVTKIHGLRMLDGKLISRFPFKSADSTNIARNVGIDCRWTGPYQPPSKAGRASVMRARIESVQAPTIWTPTTQLEQLAFL